MKNYVKKLEDFINESFREDFKPTEPFKFFEDYRLTIVLKFKDDNFNISWFKPDTKGNRPDYELNNIQIDKYMTEEINNLPIFNNIMEAFLTSNFDPSVNGTTNYDILKKNKGQIVFEWEYSNIDTRIKSFQLHTKFDKDIRNEINESKELFKTILEQMQNKMMSNSESKKVRINEATIKPVRMFDEMITLGYLDSIVKDLEEYKDSSKLSNVKYRYEVIVHYVDVYLADKSYKVNSREIDSLLELILDEYFSD